MLRFRLFGIDVEVQFFFWIVAFFLGLSGGMSDLETSAGRYRMLIWMFVVFVSVLVHEFGHALAILRVKAEPSITLHGMGGTTHWRPVLPVGRLQQIGISLAGPFAGFALAAVVYGIFHLLPELVGQLPMLALYGIQSLLWVNVSWGIFNLLPVLPLDGGHVLEHALGPKRVRLTAGISFAIAVAITITCLMGRQFWIAMIFGLSAMQSFQRLRAEPAVVNDARRRVAKEAEMPAEAAALIQTARHALSNDETARALELARRVLEGDEGTFTPPPIAIVQALEVTAWAQLADGKIAAASEALAQARKVGEPDAAVVGAVALAQKDYAAARKVLEGARAKGDDRKEIVGPLVQALIAQGEVARAAAVALDIVDQLSDDDARQMARLAFEGAAYDWAARLDEALFARTSLADDAYEAARALALGGDADRALEMLRHAVAAGFTDRARAWSDTALKELRARRLDDVVPRP